MIRLPNTGTYSLELVTAQNGAQVVVCYSDATSNTYVGGIQTTTIVSATTTTICSTPAASTIRDVDEINIKNTFAGSHTITVQVDAAATNIPLVTAALLTDESLNYTHGSGWQCKDANGNTKTTPLTAMTSAQLAALLSDETGSGAAVFATSPAFVTSVTGSASMDVFNTVSTTVNAFGAATALSIGAATGTLTLNNPAVSFKAGAVGTPSIYLDGDTTSGLYRIAANEIGVAISGVERGHWSSTGLGVTGVITGTSIQSTPVGSVTPAAGAFTTLSASSNCTLSGVVSIGGSVASTKALSIEHTALTGTSQFGLTSQATFTSAATTLMACGYFRINTAASVFTTSDAVACYVQGALKGAGATLTNVHGIYIGDQTVGSSNYGITNLVSSGANKWGYYGSGTANNALAGNTRFGGVTAPVATVDVTGNIAATTSILSSGATSGIGYTTGAGGTVAQGSGSGKATGVTLAKVCGTITMDGASLAADTTVTFLLTMTGFTLNATDQLVLSHISVGTFGAYILNARYASATTMNIDVHNATPGALAEAIVIQYSLIRSVAA